MEEYNMDIERVVLNISNRLKKITADNNIIADYAVICACAQQLLDEVFSGMYEFPIDIEELIHKMDIDVIYQPLNDLLLNNTDEKRLYRIVGKNLKRKNLFTNRVHNNILIDDTANYADQRYALAHELAHYLIHQKDDTIDSEYYIMPMLFKDMEEMVADCFATFLLIPVPLFLKEFDEYIKNQVELVNTSEWLKYLSVVTEVSYENVAIGYQMLRFVCGYVHNMIYKTPVSSKENDPFMERFIKKIQVSIDEEMLNRLFY